MNSNNSAMILPLERITFMHIMLGNRCNHHCSMCFQPEFESMMDPIIYKERLDPVFPYLRSVVLQGGEPTILPSARELIRNMTAQNSQVRFCIMTNGHHFDEWWSDVFIRYGERANFSLNATTKATYDRITRGGDWNRTIANFRRLIRMKREAGQDHPQIAASFVVIKENLSEFSDFIVFIRDLGADQVRFFFDPNLFPTDIAELKNQLERAAYVRSSIDIEGFNLFESFAREQFGKADRSSQHDAKSPSVATPALVEVVRAPVARKAKKYCPFPFEGITVETDGRVRFCCMTEVYLGNLHDAPIDVLWNNAAAIRFRDMVKQNRHAEAGCNTLQCSKFE